VGIIAVGFVDTLNSHSCSHSIFFLCISFGALVCSKRIFIDSQGAFVKSNSNAILSQGSYVTKLEYDAQKAADSQQT
jgi:hypothetical protein